MNRTSVGVLSEHIRQRGRRSLAATEDVGLPILTIEKESCQ
jgi:hypothetical protein